MTYPAGYDESEFSSDPEWDEPEPEPVLVQAVESETVAPEFASCMQWQLTPGNVIPVVPRNLHREETVIWVGGNTGQAVFLNTNQQALMGSTPQGVVLNQSSQSFTYKGQQTLYATVTGGNIGLNVLDQVYGKVRLCLISGIVPCNGRPS